MKICYVINNPDFLISHRLEVCLKAQESGFQVHVICPNKASITKLEEFGFTVHLLEFGRDRKNPFAELQTILQLTMLFKNVQPDLVHLITIKPYLYGGIAARLAKVSAVVSAVASGVQIQMFFLGGGCLLWSRPAPPGWAEGGSVASGGEGLRRLRWLWN